MIAEKKEEKNMSSLKLISSLQLGKCDQLVSITDLFFVPYLFLFVILTY